MREESKTITLHLETDLSSKGSPAGEVQFVRSQISQVVFEDWEFNSWTEFEKEYDDVLVERLIDTIGVYKE